MSIVTKENYDQFIARDPTKYKLLLFTERKTTSPILKALSKQYKNKLHFGEVRSSEKELTTLFNISKFPTLLAITNPYENKGEIY